MAYAQGNDKGGLPVRESQKKSGPCECSKVVPNSNDKRLQKTRPEQQTAGSTRKSKTDGNGRFEPKRPDWWAAEPGVGRVANGIPNRVDRIKCLGNAVVPAQFYPIFQAIADIELGR